MSTDSTETKRRKVIGSEGRRIIASVYHYLKREHEFTVQFQEPNCDLSHLRNIGQRTADATGVSVKTVQRILKEEKESPSTSSDNSSPVKKKRKKDIKKEVDDITVDENPITIVNVKMEPTQSLGASVETVQRILKEEKELPSTSSDISPSVKKKRKRDIKKEVDDITIDENPITIVNVKMEPTQSFGASVETVQRILKEEKQLPSTSSDISPSVKKKRKRDIKKEVDDITVDENPITIVDVKMEPTQSS